MTLKTPATFDAAHHHVALRAQALSEALYPPSALVLAPGGYARLDGRLVTLTPYARKRVLSLAGVKPSWAAPEVFEARIPRLNSLLADLGAAVQFRLRGDEVVSVLSGTYQTVTVERVFAVLRRYLGPVAERYSVVRFDEDDGSVQVTCTLPAVHTFAGAQPGFRSQTGSRGVQVRTGWHLSVSESGEGPVEVFDAMARADDGAVILGRTSRALYTRTHRRCVDVELASGFMVALATAGELPVTSEPCPAVEGYAARVADLLRLTETSSVSVPVSVRDAAIRAAEAHAGEGKVTTDALAWGLSESAPVSPLYARTAVELAAGRVLCNHVP